MTSQKHYTASELTEYALNQLTMMGCIVWRQNNLAVRGRKFIGMRGMPDIIGYGMDGRAVYCEVKSEGDRLSDDQIAFMDRATANDCATYICKVGEHGGAYLTTWEMHRKQNNTM